MDLVLREVTAEDVETFFDHQADPVSSEMAAVASRELDAHRAHWMKILADPTTIDRTIVFEGVVAGNCVSWLMDGDRYIGYWIDRALWGRGIASAALDLFLQVVRDRPLHATAASHNAASHRVLEKAGFVLTGEEPDPTREGGGLRIYELA
ncbi:MAG: GNAT family N-acetyltransferase [Actinomycetota bacterium]